MREYEVLPSASAGFRASLIATLAAVVVVAMTGIGLFHQRASLNGARIDWEKASIATHLIEQKERARLDLQALAAMLPARAVVDAARGAAAGPQFERIYQLDAQRQKLVPAGSASFEQTRDASLVAAAIAPILASLAHAEKSGNGLDDVTASLPPAARDSASDLVLLDGALFAATIVANVAPTTAVPDEAAPALVGLQRIDAPWLGALADAAGTGPLSLIAADAMGEGRITLAMGSTGTSPAILSWQAQRPGDAFIINYGLPLAGCAILIALLLIVQAHRAIKHLRISEARAKKLAGFDMLSGLPNRFLFGQLMDQEFARAARGGGPFALLYLDIDRFKELNDTYGHDAGDAIIVGATERISSVLRAGDRLARFGGDEFAILQTEIAGPKDVEELASRIFDAMKKPIGIGDQDVTIRLSTGIALYPQDALQRQDLMSNADNALSRAKLEGRNRYMFFQKRLGDDMRSRKTTEDELRKAIETGGLVVYYQPIMTVDGERMAAVEALVRWQHPVRGLVPPDHFISLAEDRGLILPLGEFVLRQACRDGRRWPGLRVAVNVSPIQFRQKDFAEMVERVLQEEQFDASQLELELTEGVVIADADQAENVMMDLRALGVRLALDDFGTGYSSLVYLRRFAFDKIKIDRSFLESMEATGESAIIVHSIIHLGRALGLTVTAEGIETAEQHRFLQAAGAHELQGYLFSRPVPGEQIDRLLEAQAARGIKPVLRSVA